MKRILWFVIIIGILAGAGYFVYRSYIPKVIAKAIVGEQVPSYFPEEVKEKVTKIKKPLNGGADIIIQNMHKSNITLDQILKAIDEVTEEQAYAMLDTLNKRQIQNPNEVFDVAKKNFPVDFDVEVFRKPYQQKVNMRLINKGLAYANKYKGSDEMDFESARSIVKNILIQKHQEFIKLME